jgi:hypothetical protein
MGKWQNDLMLDAALDYIKTNADKMVLCSAQPTTYTEANATYALADVAIDSSDFTHADGTSGRKTTIAQQLNVTVDVSGDGTHVALVKTGTSALLYVTTCATLTVVATETINFPAWSIQLGDAS